MTWTGPMKDDCKIFWTNVSQSVTNFLMLQCIKLSIFALKTPISHNIMTGQHRIWPDLNIQRNNCHMLYILIFCMVLFHLKPGEAYSCAGSMPTYLRAWLQFPTCDMTESVTIKTGHCIRRQQHQHASMYHKLVNKFVSEGDWRISTHADPTSTRRVIYRNGESLAWRLRQRISTVMFTCGWAWPTCWRIRRILGFWESKVHSKRYIHTLPTGICG